MSIDAWEEEATELMGMTIHRPSAHHVQLREEGRVFVDWWPSKGTTLKDGKRGPVCHTGDDLIVWLRTTG